MQFSIYKVPNLMQVLLSIMHKIDLSLESISNLVFLKRIHFYLIYYTILELLGVKTHASL